MFNSLSYAYLVNFAQYAFNFFNGKINNVFPAKTLLIDSETNENKYGSNNGSIVIIYMINIMNYFIKNPNMATEKNIKGLILYVIIHELLHLDQNFNAYYNIGLDNINEINDLIENSNDSMTFWTIIDIINNPTLLNYGFDCNLVRLNYNVSEEKDKIYYENYYKINSPLDKALYYLKTLFTENLFDTDITKILTDNFTYDTIALELIDGERNRTLIDTLIMINGIYSNYENIMQFYDIMVLGSINKLYNTYHKSILISSDNRTKLIRFEISSSKIIPITMIDKDQIITKVDIK